MNKPPISLFNRKSRQKIVCPMCLNSNLEKWDKKHYEDEYFCRDCGCRFELDTEEFLQDDEPIFYSPYLFMCSSGNRNRFDRVLNWLRVKHPEWRKYLDDPEFSGFLRDFYAYNDWLNRGNGPSFQELVEDGGFETDVGSILGKGDSLDVYFEIQFDSTPDDEREEIDELWHRFQALKNTYSNQFSNKNRRKGRRNKGDKI